MPYFYRRNKDQPLTHSGDEVLHETDLPEQTAQQPWGRTYQGKHRSRHLVGNQITGEQWERETQAFIEAKRHKRATPIVEGETVSKPKKPARKEPLSAEDLNRYSGWASGLSWREYTHFDWVDETWSDPSGG